MSLRDFYYRWLCVGYCPGPAYAVLWLGPFIFSWRANRLPGDPWEFSAGWDRD